MVKEKNEETQNTVRWMKMKRKYTKTTVLQLKTSGEGSESLHP
jgi:hypothetical protein